MPDKRPSSTKLRRQTFEFWRYQTEHGWRMKCACCGAEFNPATTAWDADHQIPHAIGGKDEPPNVRPMLERCHQLKTRKSDIPVIAKGKRVSDKTYGVRRSSSKLSKPKGMKWDWQAGKYRPVEREWGED